jgi:hypothetical protein
MARTKKMETRRGSPEAIAKRRAARALNTLFDKGPAATGLDGRSIRRRERLKKELGEGRKGEPLKAHEVLSHATELFEMGETLRSIRKLKPRVPPAPTLDDASLAAIRTTQENYGFDPRAWKLLGIDIGVITDGSAPEDGKEARPAPKKARKKKS